MNFNLPSALETSDLILRCDLISPFLLLSVCFIHVLVEFDSNLLHRGNGLFLRLDGISRDQRNAYEEFCRLQQVSVQNAQFSHFLMTSKGRFLTFGGYVDDIQTRLALSM